MKVVTALANRLGNRSINQDRCLVLEKAGRVLLVVADGMGGHARGELAAQTAVDSLGHSFMSRQGPIQEPEAFLRQALNAAHLAIVDAGNAVVPPVTPRTTCVVCLVQDDQACWAHVGDSRLYLLRGGELLTRTRDHTPVEELLQNGIITEKELQRHPLRNSVNRCLGGSLKPPKISFGQARLEAGDLLLLCSDGLWSALSEYRLAQLPADADLEHTVNLLADEAEVSSYPHADNISLVCLRWLSAQRPANDPADVILEQAAAAVPAQKEKPPAGEDPLQQAINDIHRAMLEYAAEMKK